MSAHTPGPWRYDAGKSAILDTNGERIATYGLALRMGGPDPEAEANARLIAEAPTLLAALKEARAELAATTAPTDGDVRVVFTPAHRRFLRELLERIDAALAAAGAI